MQDRPELKYEKLSHQKWILEVGTRAFVGKTRNECLAEYMKTVKSASVVEKPSWSKGMVITAVTKLEGERFKLFKKLDNTYSISEAAKLKEEIRQKTVTIDQYHNILQRMK